MHRQWKDRGLAVRAVNLQEPRELVAQWIQQKQVTVPVLLDATGSVAQAYRVTGTPTVVLIDRAGRLVARGVGMRPWDGERGRALFETLLRTPGW